MESHHSAAEGARKLKETIRALQEQQDVQQKVPSTANVDYDQSTVPWGLACQVAAQREAASIGTPHRSTTGSGGRKRKALGVHQGPAAFTKNRKRLGGQGDPASGQRVDPFNRSTTGPLNPQELSWRAAVSATPAAYQSLTPQNDLYGDPSVHALCMLPPQPPFPHKPPTAAAAFKAVSADGRLDSKEQPPTPPVGWGSMMTPRMTEVPRSFWRTVAPDVHHQMLQREFEQGYEQHNPLQAMLAVLRAKRGLAEGDGLRRGASALETAKAAAAAAAAATSWAPSRTVSPLVGAGTPRHKIEVGPDGKQPRDDARAERAAIAAEMMNNGEGWAPATIYRGPGARAQSRWFFASGDWEWRPCTVISASLDRSSFAVRWASEDGEKRGGIKSVSRFNILFEGEDEQSLDAVKSIAVQQQQHFSQVAEHKFKMELLPLDEAPSMPSSTAASILHRVGGYVLLSPSQPILNTTHAPTMPSNNNGSGAPQEGLASGRLHTRGRRVQTSNSRGGTPIDERYLQGGLQGEGGGAGTGGERKGAGFGTATTADLFLQLHDVSMQHQLGTVPQIDVYQSQIKHADNLDHHRRTHAQTAQGGSSPRFGGMFQSDGQGSHNQPTPALQYVGWRMDQREMWVKVAHPDAPAKLKTALREADEEFAQVQNRMAYCHAFVAATGMKVPENEGLLDKTRPEPHAQASGSAQVQEQSQNEDLPGHCADNDASVQRLVSSRLLRAYSWTKAHHEISSLSAETAAAAAAAAAAFDKQAQLLKRTSSAGSNAQGTDTSAQTHSMGRLATSYTAGQALLQERASAQTEVPYYDNLVYRKRAAGIESHALFARSTLLPAWQQCTAYLSDIMSRDLFGLSELPISFMLHQHPDPKEAIKWRRYLESRKRSGVTLMSSLAAISTSPMSLVAYLNVQEGAYMTVLSDIRQRVCNQLSLILMDAAHTLHECAIAESTVQSTRGGRVIWPGVGNSAAPTTHAKLDKRDFYRMASLLNVAMYDALYSLVVENVEAYVTGLSLYSMPTLSARPLFSIMLNAVGDEIRFLPSLESFEKQLIDGIFSMLECVNSVPGFKVVLHEHHGPKSALLPFDILPELETPPIVPHDDPEIARALTIIKSTLKDSFERCTNLLSSFSRHLGLLSMDSETLRSQMMECRDAMEDGDWESIMLKQREQGDEIMRDLPTEANLGLFMVDCRALQQRLAERAEGLVATVLLTVQSDLEETSTTIVEKLQPLLDSLTQPINNLMELAKVKDVAIATPSQLSDLFIAEHQLWRGEDLMQKFKHQVPSELVERLWQAKRLPVLVEEALKHVNANMATLETRFLQSMRDEQVNFAKDIAAATERTLNWGDVYQEELAEEHLDALQSQMDILTAMIERAKKNNTMEALAGWKITSYAHLHLLRKQLLPYLELWKLVRAFKEKYQAWMYGPLFAFDLEDLETSVPSWTKITARLAKDLKGAPQVVASKYSSYMIEFESHLPLLRALRTQGMRQRHWARIKKDMPLLETMDKRHLTLHMMLQAGLGRHVAVLRELADLAARELVIEQSVSSIEEQFNRMTITFTSDNDSGIPNVYMLTNGNEIIKFVDDAQLRIKGLSASVYVDPHKESVIQWDEALSSIRAVLEGWLEVQTKWAHLAPLFGPSGLPGQLPLESRRFGEVTREWLKAVSGARAHGKLSELLRHAELLGLMVELAKGLETVFKGVMEFLEEKRANFPRFFFLSNNEIVNVLVRSHDPVSVEPFLGRCFPGIKRLVVTKDWGVRIHALISPEGEKLTLRKPVELVDVHTKKGVDVEMWMMALEKQMRVAMRETLRDALENLPKQAYEAWLLQWPAQGILLTASLAWCRDVTSLYKRGPPYSSSLHKLDGALTTQLLCVVEMILKQHLTQLQRSVLENVIIGKVYHQDVLARLHESRVDSVEDIEWLRVMRFYMEGEVIVRCGYSDITYGLEYLGNSARLVITPLTERAFSSLITAVHLHFGGAPEGPAGTGKTETVKELSRCVAKQCIVFNTTEQLDVSHMTRLLMGIASTGAWSCFDEFNRMDMEVLSVVAKQIMTIQTALASGERLFMFEGRNLALNSSLAIFITMNPMYEFRNVLPSNLKALFRPVAMMIPDYKLIAEVSLYAAGFQAASPLASHLVSVLKVASHQLANEAHYDFAMRTLKSVLLIAAQLRTAEERAALTADQEASLVRVALLRCNMSKLKTVDAQIFLGVVDREFPQAGSADNYLGDLKMHVVEAAKTLNMHATDDLVTRCLQTYSMLQIRTGVMLLGPAACGKSTVVSVLAAALTEMDSFQDPPLPPVSCVTIFPKAVSPIRLYGQYNTSTQSWEDGVLTKALRNENGYDATNRAWLVLDGPVDHVWVEALNPVLDDNCTLCLSSGETLPLREGINLIMEMDSIATASPATVSRCGMVYMAAPHFKLWHHMIKAWCASLPPTLMEFSHKLEVTVNMLFTELAKAYTDALEAESPLPRQQPTSVLASMIRIMNALLPILAQKVYQGLEDKPADACIEATALYSVVWAFEASLPQKAHAFFNILVRQMSARTINYTKTKYGETTEHSAMGFQVAMPPEGQVFDFMFDYDNIRWVRWKEHVEALLDPQCIATMGPHAFMPFGLANLMGQANTVVRDCIVTADNLPALYLMRLLLGSHSNILLMGPTGTGKTALVRALIQSADNWMPSNEQKDLALEIEASSKPPDNQMQQSLLEAAKPPAESENYSGKSPFAPMNINLSSQSTSSNTSLIIESYLLKRRRGVLGPPVGKIALMFVDDMSTSGRDMHGTQSALELLRQWCSIGGWHDERKATFKKVTDTQLVGCTTVNPLMKSIPDRLLQYVSLVGLPPISHAGFTLIFTAVLKRYMQPMTTVSNDLLPALVSATMELYRQLTATLLPVPSRPHYLFSIRHVGAVFKSMFHVHRSSRSTSLQLVKLWQHECARVFQDRILDPKERECFAKTLREASSKHLSEFADTGHPDARDVVFCTFASFGGQHYELAEYVLRPDHAPTPTGMYSPGSPPMTQGSSKPENSPVSLEALKNEAAPGVASAEMPEGVRQEDLSRMSMKRPSSKGNTTWEQQQLQERVEAVQNRTSKRKGQGKSRASSRDSSRPSTALRNLPSSTSSLQQDETEYMPPAPGSRLQELYREGWIDDGILSKEQAVHERLKAITAYYAEEYLAQTTAQPAKTDADDKKQAELDKLKGGSTLVGGSGIVDRVAAIVIHKAALMHVARITRVLSMEQGHMILVGPPGSGRRTLSRLSCHMSNVQVFEANLKDTQRGFNWRDTLKTVMHVAGVLGRPVNLLLVDVGRAAEAMLDDITHLMCSAHLPGLFKQEEQQSIIKSLKPVARAAGVQWSETDRTGASDNVLHEFFVGRCRSNLHVLLLLESNDAALQRLLVTFPKLFHLATLNMVDDWDADACFQVSDRVLESPEALYLDPSVFFMTIQSCVAMHGIAQKLCAEFNQKSGGQTVYHVTAYQYLQLLLRIKEQLPKRRALLSHDSEKYTEGVEKMVSMTDRLMKLQDEIAAMQPKLQDRKAETSQLMGMIHEEQMEAEAARAAIIPEEKQAQAAAQRKAVLVAECEAELSKVMPPLLKVLKELRNIDKSSIAELKVMKSPPAGVKLVMRAVCIMLGHVPEVLQSGRVKEADIVVQAYWEESIKVLSDFHFLENLLTYDKDAIGPEVEAQIQHFVHDPAFNPTVVSRSSKSAAVLGKWVIAMDAYQHVKKTVDPKREALSHAEMELRAQDTRLKEAQEHLATINNKIKEFEARYAEADAAKEALAADLDATQAKVTQAQRVLNVVKKEVDRWKRSGTESELKHKQVLGETLLASGYIAYMGPLPGLYREQAELEWSKELQSLGILLSPNFSLATFGGNTLTLEHWRDTGLPQSKNAIENALIMQQCPQWKLLIDPQELGNSFLRGFFGHEAPGGNKAPGQPTTPAQPFMVADQSNPGFKEDLMRAIETGAVLLLENLDEDMDDMIEQVLQQNTFHNQRGEMCIKLGDASALFNPKFHMYVTTRLKTPRFPANVLRHLCIINFSITKLQLQELLITSTLKNEMPELEQEHGVLIKQKAKNSIEITNLEEKVLHAINVTSTEALLEESEVFNMLVALQNGANDVKAKVLNIEASQNKINQVRQTIDKHLASKVVVFFFALMDIAHIRHIYQFSLRWFLSLFKDSLHSCPRSNAGYERLISLTLHFTSLLYTNVSRSLFDEDKLPFAVLLLARYTHASGLCTREEVNLLLFGRPDPGKSSLARISEGTTSKPLTVPLPPPPPQLTKGPELFPSANNPKQAPQAPSSTAPAGDKSDAFGGMFQGSGAAAAAWRQGKQTLPPVQSLAQRGASGVAPAQGGTTNMARQPSSDPKVKNMLGPMGSLQLGSNIPDFMELSAPAVMPQELCPPWLPEENWLRLKDLGKMYPYNKVLPDVFGDENAKEDMYMYYASLTIPGSELPEPPHPRLGTLTPFQRLMFIKCLQPRAFLPAAKWAVGTVLGPACTVAEPAELESAFPMSTATMPIVLISSTDQPLPQLMLFAEQHAVKVHHMAIGRGQGAAADKLIRNSVRDPCWVILENTHLAGDYMPQLCSLIQALPSMSLHWDFRLWLTTIPSEEFPGVILQMALKLVMDPPAGLQASLVSVMSALPRDIMAKVGASALPQPDDQLLAYSTNQGLVAPGTSTPPSPIPEPELRSYTSPEAPQMDGAVTSPASGQGRPVGKEWKMLVLRLCLFHAILLERQHYKALGFQRPYDFSAADFLSTIKQVRQVHKELMSSKSVLDPGGEMDAVNRALPGLLYVDGQCLYGGKVSQDWDRRLLVSLLQQQLMPGCAPNPCGDTTLPTIDMLMPTLPKLLSGGIMMELIQLENVIKEVRTLQLDSSNPVLVGLTAGASVVRQSQLTRHALNYLKQLQLMHSNDTEAGSSQPLQVALGLAQDMTRQLPFSVLPTVVSAWVALIQGKVPHTPAPLRPTAPGASPGTAQPNRHCASGEANKSAPPPGPPGRALPKRSVTMLQHPRDSQTDAPAPAAAAPPQAAGGAGDASDGDAAAGIAGVGAGGTGQVPGSERILQSVKSSLAAARKAPANRPVGSARPVNRARQLKMTEAISEEALLRWEAMGEYERRMMVQVFETEVMCYQLVLNAVHSSLKLVMTAVKGFDPVRGELQDLVKQLSSYEVPTQWLDAVPGLSLNAEGIGSWVSDLQDRLAFIYRWACEGPPVVMPLGMLARPKAYLTSVQQIHAEKQNAAVGSLVLRCCILDQPEQLSSQVAHLSPQEMEEVEVCTNEGGCLSLLQCWQLGCLINGVTLQGAMWDSVDRCLTEPAPTNIFCPMPLLWLVPMREQKQNKGSHWRTLRRSLNVQDTLPANQDLDGLITGRSKASRTRVEARRRRMTVSGLERDGSSALLHQPSHPFRVTSLPGTMLDEETESGQGGEAEGSQPASTLSASTADLWAGMTAGSEHATQQQERYTCPVYLHNQPFGGRVSNRAADVEDCLFDMQLPTGRHCPTHWVTRNVVMLVAPTSLCE